MLDVSNSSPVLTRFELQLSVLLHILDTTTVSILIFKQKINNIMEAKVKLKRTVWSKPKKKKGERRQKYISPY